MPPGSSSKGKAKPGSGLVRPSRSRNTTPVSAGSVHTSIDTSLGNYLSTAIGHIPVPSNTTLEDILDRGGNGLAIPSATVVAGMNGSVKAQLLDSIKLRGEQCDRMMRELARKRKDRAEQKRERERADRAEAEADERRQKVKKVIPKKRDREEDRPLAVGAHAVARQDGGDAHKDNSSTISSPVSPAPPSTAGVGTKSEDAESPDEPHQPPPAAPVTTFQFFGDDPSTYPDDTIYYIREVYDGMPEEEKKSILNVAHYPKSDLHDQTAGTPPDKDFSNAKPSNQVSAQAFQNYLEPYVRPFTEEDLAFLKERIPAHERAQLFIVPPRGKRHYKDIWAEEDGSMAIDRSDDTLPPNEPRGDMDLMNDDVAESEEVSTGPILARLLSTLRPERRGNQDGGEVNGYTNGDVDMDGEGDESSKAQRLDSATFMPDSRDAAWKISSPPKTDYATLDNRVMQELQYLGFLPANQTTPKYDDHYDDEVAARMRILQEELRKTMLRNGAHKQRLLDLVEERMAKQEYNTIADDLDNQLNQAYLKRNRNIGKGKKNVKRPGGAGGGSHVLAAGVGRPTVGEPIRSLMERRQKWQSHIGPVVDYGQSTIPEESIFEEEVMNKYIEREQELLNETEEV